MTMTGLLLVAEHDGNRYEITRDSLVGFYVFRYEGNGERCTHDHLQDDLDMAQECAQEEFGVPLDQWRAAEPGERPAHEALERRRREKLVDSASRLQSSRAQGGESPWWKFW